MRWWQQPERPTENLAHFDGATYAGALWVGAEVGQQDAANKAAAAAIRTSFIGGWIGLRLVTSHWDAPVMGARLAAGIDPARQKNKPPKRRSAPG
jgi:hypothetical protein